jgi:hypothetical protein
MIHKFMAGELLVIVHSGLLASSESALERYPKRTGPFGPLSALPGPLSRQSPSFGGVFHHRIVGTTAWHYRTRPKSLWNKEC